MKQMTEYSDDDSSGYSTDTSWKKNTRRKGIHHIGVIADASDSDTSLDPTTAKRLIKKLRKMKKQLINKSY